MNENKENYRRTVNVLVLGVGGNVSQGIIKALRRSNLPLKIMGACISSYSKGLYMCDEGYICPLATDENFVTWIIDFCNKHYIDIVFTGVEENIIEIARAKERICEETKAKFISSDYEKLIIGQDKYLTCNFLKESGCNYPDYCLWNDVDSAKVFANKVGYPVIAKPRSGKSSQGLFVLESDADIEMHSNLNNYVLEKCIGDENNEYTIGCYVDKKGIVQKMLIMRRRLVNGTTIWAETVENEEILEECKKICKYFKPVGPLNVQMRIDKNGRPVCFELNVRFSGTTAMRSHFGFQDVKAMILEYIYNEDVAECFELKSGEVYRFDEEFYLEKNTTLSMGKNGCIKNVKDFIMR